MSQAVKLTLSVVAFVLAFVMVVLFPGAGWEVGVVAAIGNVAQLLGFTQWRTELDAAKTWFQSKTKIGSIIGFVLVAGLLVVDYLLPLFGIHFIPTGWVQSALDWAMAASGGTILYGIFDAFSNKVTTLSNQTTPFKQ